MTRAAGVSAALGAAALLATACTAKKPPAPPPAPAPPTAALEGSSKYSFVFDPANPALGLPEDVKFDRPRPTEILKLPTYPADALAAGDGPHRELVRIIIDDHGHVSKVEDSPLGRSDGGPHAAGFRRAVEDTVRSWRFTPGILRKVVPGHDLDGDGKPDYVIATSQDIVAVYYDVKFSFEIVDGKGVVTKE